MGQISMPLIWNVYPEVHVFATVNFLVAFPQVYWHGIF